jgi:hypothetical protein
MRAFDNTVVFTVAGLNTRVWEISGVTLLDRRTLNVYT